MSGHAASRFCDDDNLGYSRSLTQAAAGSALKLDEQYRLAHLPLVNPTHPDVIPFKTGKDYRMSHHPRIHSLVLPIPFDELEKSAAYQEMQELLQAGPLAQKLAWNILPLRQDKLHATLCGSLGEGETPPLISADFRRVLKTMNPFEVELRGFLSGNFNIGRLYLKLYPEMRTGKNCIQALQYALQQKETDLYLVGLHNLKDHLTADETRGLMCLIEEWWKRPILRFTARELWLLSATDDLVLDARIEERFQLSTFQS